MTGCSAVPSIVKLLYCPSPGTRCTGARCMFIQSVVLQWLKRMTYRWSTAELNCSIPACHTAVLQERAALEPDVQRPTAAPVSAQLWARVLSASKAELQASLSAAPIQPILNLLLSSGLHCFVFLEVSVVGVRSPLLQLACPAAMVTSTHYVLHVLLSLPRSLTRCTRAQDITTTTVLLTGGVDVLAPSAAIATSAHLALCALPAPPSLPLCCCPCAQNLTTLTMLLTGGGDALTPPGISGSHGRIFPLIPPRPVFSCLGQNITTPTVLLTGGADVLAPPAAMDRMRKVMGDAGSLAGWLHTPDYGHMVRGREASFGTQKVLRLHCASSSPFA